MANDKDRIAELEKQLAESQAAHEELKATKPMIVVEKPALPPVLTPKRADLDTHDAGEFTQRATGEKFKLKVVRDDPQGRTHKLANDLHFHECTEAEMRKDFDKA